MDQKSKIINVKSTYLQELLHQQQKSVKNTSEIQSVENLFLHDTIMNTYW